MYEKEEGLQLAVGTKEAADALIEKLYKNYKSLEWVPEITPTEEMDIIQAGCNASHENTVVNLCALWWGIWILQYGAGHPENFIVQVAVHNGHPLHKKVEEINAYAWQRSSRIFKKEFPD